MRAVGFSLEAGGMGEAVEVVPGRPDLQPLTHRVILKRNLGMFSRGLASWIAPQTRGEVRAWSTFRRTYGGNWARDGFLWDCDGVRNQLLRLQRFLRERLSSTPEKGG
jgi:hypothetical protein